MPNQKKCYVCGDSTKENYFTNTNTKYLRMNMHKLLHYYKYVACPVLQIWDNMHKLLHYYKKA